MPVVDRAFSDEQLLVELPRGALDASASIWVSVDEQGVGRWTGVVGVPADLSTERIEQVVLRGPGNPALALVTRITSRDWESRIGVEGRGAPPVDLSLVPAGRWRGQEDADAFLRARRANASDPDGLISAIAAAIAERAPAALAAELDRVSQCLNTIWATHESASLRLLAGQASLALELVRLSWIGQVPDSEACPAAQALATLVEEILRQGSPSYDQAALAALKGASLLANHLLAFTSNDSHS